MTTMRRTRKCDNSYSRYSSIRIGSPSCMLRYRWEECPHILMQSKRTTMNWRRYSYQLHRKNRSGCSAHWAERYTTRRHFFCRCHVLHHTASVADSGHSMLQPLESGNNSWSIPVSMKPTLSMRIVTTSVRTIVQMTEAMRRRHRPAAGWIAAGRPTVLRSARTMFRPRQRRGQRGEVKCDVMEKACAQRKDRYTHVPLHLYLNVMQ
jgi:hypothetical protein